MALAPFAPTGPADLRDQRWLDERIETARNGIEAVIDIAMNWTEGRCVSRLVPGVSAADYVRERVGILGREAIVPLLTESNWSNRQIASVTGVSRNTVNELAQTVPVDARPAYTLGADGKERPAFRRRLDSEPDPYYAERPAPRTVSPLRQEAPSSIRVTLQAFHRDIERLVEGYRGYLSDDRFAARYGDLIAAMEAALRGDE